MAEYSNTAVQTVNPGESIQFTTAPFPCNRGFIRWRQGTGTFNLAGYVPSSYSTCCCNQNRVAQYMVDFGANIGIPEGGTEGPISVTYALDGVTLPETTMTVPIQVQNANIVFSRPDLAMTY